VGSDSGAGLEVATASRAKTIAISGSTGRKLSSGIQRVQGTIRRSMCPIHAAHHGAFKSERCGPKASKGPMWRMSNAQALIFVAAVVVHGLAAGAAGALTHSGAGERAAASFPRAARTLNP
jgi:hypothetical protein